MIRCPQCDAKNKDGSTYCEDCGATLNKSTVHVYDAPVDAPLYKTDPSKSEGEFDAGSNGRFDMLCLISFIMSLLGMSACGIFSPLTLIMCIVAYVRANKNGLKGSKLALTGIIISSVCILGLIVIVFASGSDTNA